MHFQLTDDQRALQAGVRELLAGRFGREALREAVDEAGMDGSGARLDRGLWRELGEAGFFALCLPEADGGVGLGLPEAVLAFEEAGRALLPGPLIATHLAAGTVPGAAEGLTVVTAVGGVVDGTEGGALVEWLDEADVVQGDASGAVPLQSVDPLTPLHRVHAVVGNRSAGRWGSPLLERSRELGGGWAQPTTAGADNSFAELLGAAEQLGGATRTCDMAVRYARERQQFGRPIGSFQAVKHLCAQMLVRTEVARAAVYAAAVTADPLDIATARLLADEAAVRGARDCLQIHGGMGFTWEADVHMYLKRAWVRARRGQSAVAHEESLAADLLLPEKR
ncbi:acyl-CoA/acyl-ACP dehydrogenase [Streptomyces sp. PSKA54]|uniref:Acyl-CoA/acyl-ACP dehydrogenase n=1 Tax=Streptomyces himalayensis subsp. aureolus TaxID=2758039 RepID=A0A7W2HID7_9ACTN|nr:acyl-CoA dehydrogenase family protein [Streptomyces himalayensis]MBA4864916.1 acyl-CoA/acyl-ACP dehydrogenase [Streptomyces himalayensis subsp. aureolus]